MIAKAATGSDFDGALRYLMAEDKEPVVIHSQELFSRLDHAREGPASVMGEMQACAETSTRCVKPVYHLSLSWAPEDRPTPTQVAVTAQHFLRDLGLQEHQALVVRHRDTAHAHVHIVVNRVHPDTGKMWKAGLHRQRLPPICRRVEREMGWRMVPSARVPDQVRPTARERGVEPLAQEIRRACGDRLSRARSWHELERILKMHGYAVGPSGRLAGLVFTDGERQAPASRVHRELSRPKLERRFGRSLDEARASLHRVRERMGWSRGRSREADLGR